MPVDEARPAAGDLLAIILANDSKRNAVLEAFRVDMRVVDAGKATSNTRGSLPMRKASTG
jgi:hypothetical protein